MSHLYRLFLVAAVCLLLAACISSTSASLPTTSPASLPSPTATIARATVSPSPAPTAAPATASPAPTLKPTVLRVAYFGGGRIILWTEGKGARPLVDAKNVEHVRISDDGQVVAYLERNSRG